jgi:hypothetical protein
VASLWTAVPARRRRARPLRIAGGCYGDFRSLDPRKTREMIEVAARRGIVARRNDDRDTVRIISGGAPIRVYCAVRQALPFIGS